MVDMRNRRLFGGRRQHHYPAHKRSIVEQARPQSRLASLLTSNMPKSTLTETDTVVRDRRTSPRMSPLRYLPNVSVIPHYARSGADTNKDFHTKSRNITIHLHTSLPGGHLTPGNPISAVLRLRRSSNSREELRNLPHRVEVRKPVDIMQLSSMVVLVEVQGKCG